MKLGRLLVACACGLLAVAGCSDLPTSGARAPDDSPRFSSGVVSRVVVSPSPVSVFQGGTTQLYATAYDAGNNPVYNRPVTWSSAAPSVASVGSSGVVTGTAQGSATVYAVIDGVAGSATVTVAGRIYTEQRTFSCYYEQGGRIYEDQEVWERQVTQYPNGTVVYGEPYYVTTYHYDNGPTAGIGWLPCDYYDGTNW